MNYYRPSGKVNILYTAVAFIFLLPVLAFIGFLYSYSLHNIPYLVVHFTFPLFFGIAIGLAYSAVDIIGKIEIKKSPYGLRLLLHALLTISTGLFG